MMPYSLHNYHYVNYMIIEAPRTTRASNKDMDEMTPFILFGGCRTLSRFTQLGEAISRFSQTNAQDSDQDHSSTDEMVVCELLFKEDGPSDNRKYSPYIAEYTHF